MAMGVIVCGMKHCGKSTLGRMLAHRLAVPFRDLDNIIEEMHAQETGAQMSCREIYTRYGETEFRRRESTAAARIASLMRSTAPSAACIGISGVLAVGGGTPDNRAAMASLEEAGLWIYLEESPAILYNRILAKGLPPFLEGDDPKSRFDEIYNRRTKLYRDAAHRVVNLGGRGIEESFELLFAAVSAPLGDTDIRHDAF